MGNFVCSVAAEIAFLRGVILSRVNSLPLLLIAMIGHAGALLKSAQALLKNSVAFTIVSTAFLVRHNQSVT